MQLRPIKEGQHQVFNIGLTSLEGWHQHGNQITVESVGSTAVVVVIRAEAAIAWRPSLCVAVIVTMPTGLAVLTTMSCGCQNVWCHSSFSHCCHGKHGLLLWSTGSHNGSRRIASSHYQSMEEPINGKTNSNINNQQHYRNDRSILILVKDSNQRLLEQWKIEHPFSVLFNHIAYQVGTLYVLQYPDSPPAQFFQSLAKAVRENVADIKYPNKLWTTMQYDKEQHVLTVKSPTVGGSTVNPRLSYVSACRCASCNGSNDEMTNSVSVQHTGNHSTMAHASDGKLRAIGGLVDIDTCTLSSNPSIGSRARRRIPAKWMLSILPT